LAAPLRIGESDLFFLALIVGFAVAIPAWFIASRYAAMLILAIGERRGSDQTAKGLRVGEAILCGALFLGCLALAFWIASALTH
jgi:hypothetical protein